MSGSHGGAVIDPGMMFRLTTVITLTGGTLFLMWLGEQITQRGVGQGTSLIIFAGIVAELPRAMAATLELGRTGALSTFFILFLIVLVVAVITFRSEEHTSELQSLMRISYYDFCLKKKKTKLTI